MEDHWPRQQGAVGDRWRWNPPPSQSPSSAADQQPRSWRDQARIFIEPFSYLRDPLKTVFQYLPDPWLGGDTARRKVQAMQRAIAENAHRMLYGSWEGSATDSVLEYALWRAEEGVG